MILMVSIGFLLAALLLFAVLIWRHPVLVGFIVLGVAVTLDCLNVGTSGIDVTVSIYLDDIACAALATAAAIVVFRNRGLSHALCWPALILLGLATLNFIRGATIYGVKPAGNGVRTMVYLVIPVVAISAMHQTRRINVPRIVAWLCGASCVFTAVAILRWMGVLPTPEDIVGADNFRQLTRALPAEYPMMIAQTLIAVLAMQLIRGVRSGGVLTAACFGVTLLAFQHRSVWVATAVGLMWLAFRSVRYAGREWMRLAFVSTAGFVLGAVLLLASGQADKVISLLKNNVNETQQDDSTWAWRVDGFYEATDRALSSGAVEAAIGPAAGRDLRQVADIASIHIHDRYLDTLAYYGVAGLMVFGTWLWMFGVRLWRFRSLARHRLDGSIEAALLEALLISEITYFVAYAGGLLHGAMLGLLWAASESAPEPVCGRTPAESAISAPAI